METVLIVLIVISAIGIILATLLMEPKAEGMGSISGSAANVFGHSASRGKEALLQNITIGCGVVFALSTIVFAALN